MSEFDYINSQYGLSVKRGSRFEYTGDKRGPLLGRVTSANGQYINVRFDNEPTKTIGPFHPTWEMRYLDPISGA